MSATRRSWDRFLGELRRWYDPPIGPGDGVGADEIAEAEERLGLRLPRALREFHELVGARLGRFVQDPIFRLEDVRVEDGVLFVSGENQGCYGCAVRLEDAALDDPPVQLCWDDGSQEVASTSLADFLALLTVRETVLAGDGCAYGGEEGPLGSLREGVEALMPGDWTMDHAELAALEQAFPLRPLPGVAGFGWRLLADAHTLILCEGSERASLDRSEQVFACALADSVEALDALYRLAGFEVHDDDDDDDDDDDA